MGFTAEQLVERRKGIGGSDAPSVFGCGYLSPLELYFRKRGEIDDSGEANEAMFWGTTLEEPIADEWAKRKGVKIRRVPSMQWSKKYPWMFVSMDRHIMGDKRGPGLLEVKNFNEFRGRELDEKDADTIPLSVRIQHMHGLAVTGWTWGEIAILVGGNRLLSWEVEREPEAIETLIDTERIFMERVQAGAPPDVDAHAAEILAGVYAKGGGEAITTMDTRIHDIGNRALRLRADVKAAEFRLDECKNFLKLYMQNSEMLTMPGVGTFTWKRGKDKSVKVFQESAFAKDHPDLYAKYVQKEVKAAGRTFRMKAEGDTGEE